MIFVSALSVLLQFIAAYLSIRMIRITGKRRALILIAAAITFAALRRSYALFRLITANTGNPPDTTGELFSFLTSVCMVIGVAYIAPLFLSIKRSEESLRKSETKFRIVSDNTYDWEYWLSPEGSFYYISPSCQRISGYEAAEFIAEPDMLVRIVHPDDRESYENHQRHVEEKKAPDEIEFRIVRADGTVRWIGHVCQPVFDSQGNCMGIRASNRDITERKDAEEKMLKEKNFSDTVINSLPGTFYLFDEKGKFLKWNKNLEVVTEYPAEEINRMTPADFFDENDRPLIKDKIKEVFVNGWAEMEAKFVSQSGKKIPYYFTGTCLKVGEQSCVAGTGFDITGRIEAEDKTKQTHAELDQIFNSAADGMRVLDLDCNPLKLNRTFLNMLNIDKEEAMGRKCYEMFPCPRRKKANCSILRVLKGEKLFEEEIIINRSDGTKIFCILHVTPFYGPDGSLAGIIEDFKDITERKKLELQLIQSQKLEALGRLAGGIAHDFNNLLTPIIGYSDLLLTELPDNIFATDKLRVVRDAGSQAADLVKHLLAFGRKQVLEMKPVNLNEIVLNMSRLFERTIGKDIELELNIKKPVENVSADAGQIGQVLMNLALNARGAMPYGGRLTIETSDVYLDKTYEAMHSQLVKPGEYVMLSVADSGIGMSREVQEKIFEPFFTTKKAGEGTGLGLSTTYGIIRQHNGYIWVYSEPDRGTIFKVYLPAIKEKAGETKNHEQPTIVGGTETILVVDDEPTVREFVVDVLRHLGYKVLEASCAKDALKICGHNQGKIDILLTDLVMPGMNGQEFAAIFKEKSPESKVILMSGYSETVISNSDIPASFIQKPIVVEKLTGNIREALVG